MSSIHTEQFIPAKLAQALANSLFPELDSQLRAGRHIGIDSLDNHAFLMDFQDELTDFYARYNVELIRAPEGFFTYAPVQRRLFLVQCFLKWICWSAKFFVISTLALSD